MFWLVVFASTTHTKCRPKQRQACARPIPRFPELDSIITDRPGSSAPFSIFSVSMLIAARSLMLPAGLNLSSFAKT